MTDEFMNFAKPEAQDLTIWICQAIDGLIQELRLIRTCLESIKKEMLDYAYRY